MVEWVTTHILFIYLFAQPLSCFSSKDLWIDLWIFIYIDEVDWPKVTQVEFPNLAKTQLHIKTSYYWVGWPDVTCQTPVGGSG